MKTTEHHEQIRLIAWADSLELPLFAIPNGGKRNRVVAMKLKAEGVRPGIPDLFLPVASGGFHGLFLEMKREDGGTLSKTQKEWIKKLNANGYMAVVCHGFEKAREIIMEYVGIGQEDK